MNATTSNSTGAAQQPEDSSRTASRSPNRASRKVLAIASGGGHWVQLLRLMPAFEGHRVTFITVNNSYRSDVAGHPFRVVNDATRWNKLALLWSAIRILAAIIVERPDVIVSTGAAPGFMAIRLGKWLGARTVWLDSIANVSTLSLSGKKIGPHADLWLTQWPHLARADGPQFRGSVI
jgi:UDP-N-acetylglucosamine:LPS N-acetylglucosamine transferase